MQTRIWVLLVTLGLLGGSAEAGPYKVWLGDWTKVRRGVERVWIGTAPFCGGKASDCTKRGWVYRGSSKRGDGKTCTTGRKVLCERPRYVRKKKMITLDSRNQYEWVGTAPFCAGKRSDCTKRGMRAVMFHKRGNGKTCTSGRKVLCSKRKDRRDSRFTYQWFGTAPLCGGSPKDCTNRGMTYVRSDRRGDGKACQTGMKVLCKRKKRDRRFRYRWFGTAPACGGSPKDCRSRSMQFVRRDKKGDGKSCVTGWKVECRVRKPPPPRAIPASQPNNLRVLAYNIYMRPRALFKNGQPHRAKLLPSYVRGFDVIVFSEAFDGTTWNRLRAGLRGAGYRYFTNVVGRTRLPKKTTNGGVVIASRHRIEVSRGFAFGSTCKGTDCMADKGVMYARIRKGGRPYHIFGTHTQAWPESENAKVRARQFKYIRKLINATRIPANQAVIIAGDLNVDKANRTEYANMLRILRAAAPAYVGHRYTADPALNDLVGGTDQEYLDYVLYSTTHLRPKSGFHEARAIRSSRRWRDYKFESWYYDLSDHYPVFGYLVF